MTSQATGGREENVSRRDFLRVGGMSFVGLSVGERAALARSRDTAESRSCIFLLMAGGASQLETFDPKPTAPAEFRGPMKAISTAVPGLAFSEGLPRLAQRADRLAVIRSLRHDAAPIHETGLQLLQTGRLARLGRTYPSFGSVVARLLGSRGEAPPFVLLPRPLRQTGVNADRGQTAGFLGTEFDPLAQFDGAADEWPEQSGAWPGAANAGAFLRSSPGHPAEPQDQPRKSRAARKRAATMPVCDELSELVADEPESVRRAYGQTRFGLLCLQARRLVEAGVRCVTVNLFDSLTRQVTWDCHARTPASPGTLFDYRDTLCPQFDRALAALLDDLQQRGLLEETLVLATGEFGRSPKINNAGGRDHWPGCWSALVAGGGVQGGRVVGASDQVARAPIDRPVDAAELTATIYHSLGLPADASLPCGDGTVLPLVECRAVAELF